MSDSFRFIDDSPPVVKTRDDIIKEIMEHLKFLLKNQISSMAAECRPKQPIRPFDRDDNSKKAESAATGVLHHSYRDAKIKSLQRKPTGLTGKLHELFTHINPSELLTKETLKGIPKEVIDNFVRIKNAKLHRAADASRRLVPKAKYFRALNVDSMSERDKQIVFNELQKKELLRLIDELISAGIEIAHMEDMKRRIATPGLSCSIYEIFWLIHKYIEYKYSIAAPPITSSAVLLEFIRHELPDLFAIMAPYYGDNSDFAKFQTYVILLDKFIFLVLQEQGISVDGDSAAVANLIIGKIRDNLCHFVTIAGDPNIVIKTSTLGDMTILINKGVLDYLNSAVLDIEAPGNAGASAAEGGNRRRIKKYKNRTSRRTSRRTNRVTKYRTNRYKIKNKKTRKIRKIR